MRVRHDPGRSELFRLCEWLLVILHIINDIVDAAVTHTEHISADFSLILEQVFLETGRHFPW